MDDLIRALQILRKYYNSEYPTTCEHDVLYVCIDPDIVSSSDIKELNELGFVVGDMGSFMSYKYGSC